MKRYMAILLAVVMVLSMAGCQKASGLFHENSTSEGAVSEDGNEDGIFKVGFIFPAEEEAPDTETREDAVRKMQKELDLTDDQILMSTNISKEACSDEIKALMKKGCDVIFALGARYEEPVLAAAEEHSGVQFCIEGGREIVNNTLSNVHTFNSRIHEAYFAAGIAAGMKINDMLNEGKIDRYDCRIGFVAYKETPETTTCINAFYLGVKRMCSQSTVDVRYVGKRGNYDADGEAARQLAASGVSLMCQYTFTTAVAAVCAQNEIPVIGNEENIINIAPNMAIASTYTDWSVYYIKAVKAAMEGEEIEQDWCGGYKSGTVRLTQLNDKHVPYGTASRLIEVEQELRNQTAKIYDTERFTIKGESLESLMEYSDEFKPYKKYVKDGEYKEQSKVSNPTFSHLIDGISISTTNYITESEETDTTEEEQ